MAKTGWQLFGEGGGLRPVEVRLESWENKRSYADTKAEALKRLRNHVAPYLEQIERLEADEFAETKKLPPNKAWQYKTKYRNAVVTAKTKKRAIELAHETRYEFDQYWKKCSGDWWYELAAQEAVWVEETDEEEVRTGVFYRPMSYQQKQEIADAHAARFLSVPDKDLILRLGERTAQASESELGTPYRIEVAIDMCDYREDTIRVEISVDDHLEWAGSGHATVLRDLHVTQEINWACEGFRNDDF